jgi:hypothetical protein
MRKANLLFINVLLFVTFSVIGFLIYSKHNQFEGEDIFNNISYIKSMSLYLGVPFGITLLSAIPLGRLPKKENTKVDCAVICVLIGVLCIVCSIILNSQAQNLGAFFKNLYIENLNNEIYKVLGIGIVSYIGFLLLVLVLRYAKIVVFEKNPDLESKKNGLALIAALTSVALGILGVLIYIFLTGNRTNNYYSQVKVQDWGILASYVLLYLMVTSFASYKKPNWITFIVSNIIFILIATGLYFGLKNHQYYSNAIFSIVFISWAFGGELLFILLNMSLRPFARFIVKGDLNVDYASKEDFVLLTEALVKSNHRKEEVKVEPKDEEVQEELSDKAKEELIKAEQEKALREKYMINLEDENKILRARLEDMEKRINALETKRLDQTQAKDATSDESTLANAPHYETETVSIIRKGFKSRLIADAPDELKDLYNKIANMCSKYKKTKIRESFSKEVIHVGRQNVAILKMSPSGKAMYLFLALDKSYLDGKYHLKDYSEKKSYQATPLRLRVKSARSIQYALELLEVVLNNNAEKYKLDREDIDVSDQLKPQTEAEMIRNGLIKKHIVENTYLVEPVYEEKAEEVDEDDEKEEE